MEQRYPSSALHSKTFVPKDIPNIHLLWLSELLTVVVQCSAGTAGPQQASGWEQASAKTKDHDAISFVSRLNEYILSIFRCTMNFKVFLLTSLHWQKSLMAKSLKKKLK